MSGYADMSELFEGAGLGIPPVPEEIRPEVREIRPWTYATFDIDADDLYYIDGALQGALDRRGHDSFAVGHVGHGLNSYAIGYQTVTSSLIVVLQLAWGGVYMDAEKATDAIRRSFGAVSSLLSFHPPANVAEGHLLVVWSDFRQLNAVGWLSPNELVDVRAWAEEHATVDPIAAAQAWAVEEGWASRPPGDEAYDRFVWKPGDVTIVRKGDRSEEDPWGVLVWNMALMSPGPYAAEENMAHLWELIDRYNVKVALLNEASVPHLKAADAVLREDSDGPLVTFSEEGILGRDFWTDEDGVRKAWNRTRWSSAVMSPLGTHAIGEGDVKARSSSRRKPIDIAFTNSRPGTWIAATVQVGEEQVTCVSLYGLVEELTDASMHRSLSEVSPLFSDPDYSGSVLLGGDFNVSTGLADASDRERSRVVLDRIEAYDLVDCLKSWRKEHRLPPMPGCRCVDDPCLHTLTRVTPQESGADLPWVRRFPIQVDYLFASRQLADRLDDVVELPPEEWERFSDHRPIVAMFRAT